MTVSVTLNNVGSLTTNPTSAQAEINTNNSTIETGFSEALNASGDTMTGVLNMNSNQIINLPAPLTADSPVRLADINSYSGGGTITNIPSGGTTGQMLTKNSNNNYDVKWTSADPYEITAGSNIVLTGNAPTTVATTTAPTFSSVTVPAITGPTAVTATASTAFAVGQNGTTNPNFTVSNATSNSTTGIEVLGTPAGSGAILRATSSNANENLYLEPAGTGYVSAYNSTNPTYFEIGAAGVSQGNLALCGVTSGNTTVVVPAVASGILTLPSATDQLVGRATTDTLTNKTISGASNTISNINLASQVTGNLPVTNLNGGTSAASTTFWRGDGIWAASPSGSIVFLETLSPSNVASISSSVSWSGYSSIKVLFYNIVPVTSSVNFIGQINAGGLQTTGYSGSVLTVSSTTVTGASVPSTSFFLGSQTTGTSGSGCFILYNISSSSLIKTLSGENTYSNNSIQRYGGVNTATAAVTSMTFSMTSGNISSGIIRIYGIV